MFFIWIKNFSFLESHLLCSFYKNADETIPHLFYGCNITKELWKSLISLFDKRLHLPHLTPQTAFLRFTNTYCNDILLKNHILLLFKTYVYNSRKHEKMLLSNLIRNIKKVKKSKILWKKLLETMKRRLCYRTKSGKKNWKQLRQETVVSLIYRRVGGRVEHFCCEISVVFLWLICNFILLLFNGKGNNINITKK